MTKVRRRPSPRAPPPESVQEREPVVLDEALIAETYRLKHTPDQSDWFDAINPRTGTKYEVKSCLRDVGDKYPAAGRFRVRRDQTRSLVASSAHGAAWYCFGLVDYDAGAIYLQRRKTSTVARIVHEHGGWNHAGHEKFEYQNKLPIESVLGV